MKIAVVGKANIAEVCVDVYRISSPFSAKDLLDYDLVIDFSSKEDVIDNIIMYCHLGLCAVIANSLWLEQKDMILGLCNDDDIHIYYGDFNYLSSDLISIVKKCYDKKEKLPFERIC